MRKAFIIFHVLLSLSPLTTFANCTFLADLHGPGKYAGLRAAAKGASRLNSPTKGSGFKIGEQLPSDLRSISNITTPSGETYQVTFLGEGAYGAVYDVNGSSKKIIKIPKNANAQWDAKLEVEQAKKLKDSGIPHASILDHGANGSYLVKEKIEGKSLAKFVGNYTDDQMDQLVKIYQNSVKNNITLDLKMDNFILTPVGKDCLN